jgi:Spy/CpxP family protein refolding chaperone
MEVSMKRILAFVLAGILLLGTGSALAQPPSDEDIPQARNVKPLIGKLNLNEQQKKQVEQMRFDMQKQLIGVRGKLQTARLELHQLLAADTPDKAAIEKKMNEIAQIRVQKESVRLDHWFQVNSLLTPDQQKVWKEALKHPFRSRARGWMGQRMRDGRGPHGDRSFMGRRGGTMRGHPGMMMSPETPEKK